MVHHVRQLVANCVVSPFAAKEMSENLGFYKLCAKKNKVEMIILCRFLTTSDLFDTDFCYLLSKTENC